MFDPEHPENTSQQEEVCVCGETLKSWQSEKYCPACDGDPDEMLVLDI